MSLTKARISQSLSSYQLLACPLAIVTLLVSLTSRPLLGQAQDASRWGNVSGWKGNVLISGEGSGTPVGLPVICSGEYSNNQIISLKPEVTGQFPRWVGIASPDNISLSISSIVTCEGKSCLTTIAPLGGLTSDEFGIQLDPTQRTYLWTVGTLTKAVVSVCGVLSLPEFAWGPISGPSGGPIPYLGATYPLPDKGVRLKMTLPTYMDSNPLYPVPWNISWDFKPTCKVTLPHTWGQGNDPWGGMQYNRDRGETISSKGCALTSLAMALAYAGVTTLPDGTALDPGTLNAFLNNSPELHQLVVSWEDSHGFGGVQTGFTVSGFTNAHGVIWDADTHYVTDFGKLKFTTFGPIRESVPGSDSDSAKQVLDVALCGSNPHPVIVAVTGSDGSYPGHFVLVTGRDGDTYMIADPATGTMRTLGDYGDKFQTRGSVVDPPSDISALDFTSDGNVSLLVTDQLQNRTGFDPSSGQVLQQIPGSAYFVDRVTDGDITGINPAGEPEPETHAAQIFQPAQGSYFIVVNGLRQGPYTLSVYAFSQDGGPEPPVVLNGISEPGATFTYQLHYTSTPGSILTVTPMPGDRNGDGVVNCADLAIVKASFGKKIGQPGFDPRADVNGDGIVNVLDLATVARQLPAGTVCH
jgi:hypothetical protein